MKYGAARTIYFAPSDLKQFTVGLLWGEKGAISTTIERGELSKDFYDATHVGF